MSPSMAHSFYKSGFLAGAQVGVSFGKGKYNSSLNFNPIFAVNSVSASGSGNKTAALFGLLGGYRHLFNQDYTIGLIIEANLLTGNEIKKNLGHTSPFGTANFNNSLKKSFTVIPTVALGKVFCGRWHASLGLGLAIARFKLQATGVGTNPAFSQNANQTKIGFVPSLGVEYAATQNVSIIGNVAYEIYGKMSKTLTSPTTQLITYATSVKPTYLTLKVGAVYRF